MNILVALSALRRLLPGRGAWSSSQPLHACYALATDGERDYPDMVMVSALSLRRIYPTSKITILTDDDSLPGLGCALAHLAENGAQIRSVGQFSGTPRMRSRFVKTQVRNVIDGDFLYLDADTVAIRNFDGLFACRAPLSAAIDRNCVDPRGGFPAWVIPDFVRLGWRHPTRCYLNAGVVLWRDCEDARALGKLWHENWLHYSRSVDNPADQPSFNHSIDLLGIAPKIMDDAFNARVGVLPEFAKGACIYHLLSGDERANGTFIDELLVRYRRDGSVDFPLIERVAASDDPWIDA
jgi:hypothetical protein